MQRINEQHGRHLTVSHKGTKEQREQAFDTKPHWHVVAVVLLKNGKTGVKVLPRVAPRIVNYYNQVGSHSSVEEIKLFLSKDIFFNRFPNSSALNVIFVDHDEVMKHLLDAERLVCDGKSLTSK